MKSKKMALMATALICLLMVGCSSQENNLSSESQAPSESSASSSEVGDVLSAGSYQMIRDVFIKQYRDAVESAQKQLAVFNAGDDWWAAYDGIKQNISSISNTFFGQESKIPAECKTDFENLKSAANSFAQAIEKVNEAYGKTAAEQTAIVSEAAGMFNQANSAWKQAAPDVLAR